eukprot:gene15248-20647_t
MRLVRVGLDRGHARHIGVPLRKQRQQRLVDPIELGADIFLGGAVLGGFDQDVARFGQNASSRGLHVPRRDFNSGVAHRRKCPGWWRWEPPRGDLFMLRLALLVAVAGISTAAVAEDVSVANGARIAVIGGCHDCHTVGYGESGGKIDPAAALKGNPVGYGGPWGVNY